MTSVISSEWRQSPLLNTWRTFKSHLEHQLYSMVSRSQQGESALQTEASKRHMEAAKLTSVDIRDVMEFVKLKEAWYFASEP